GRLTLEADLELPGGHLDGTIISTRIVVRNRQGNGAKPRLLTALRSLKAEVDGPLRRDGQIDAQAIARRRKEFVYRPRCGQVVVFGHLEQQAVRRNAAAAAQGKLPVRQPLTVHTKLE